MNTPISIRNKMENKYKVQLKSENIVNKLNESTEAYGLCKLPQ